MAPNLPPRRLLLFLLLLLLLRLRRHCASAAIVADGLLYPNFTASSIHYLEKSGVFLTSINSVFSGVLSTDSPQSPFVFSILHAPTATAVWSANPAAPAPYTASFSFSTAGLSISLASGYPLWSTPRLHRPAAALRLLDSGNLVLLDANNISLWQSFENPTDTLLSSQRLPAGKSLSTPSGDFRLLVTAVDVVLLWAIGEQAYWRFSVDHRSPKDLNASVAYMADDESGLSLFSDTGRSLYRINLPPAKLRIMKLDSGGRFLVLGYSGDGSSLSEELAAPSGACDLPLSCNPLEVCTKQSTGGATCNCPVMFTVSPGGACSPANGSILAYSSTCGTASSEHDRVKLSYVSLENGIGYFAGNFAAPASSGGDMSSCRSLCTLNCSCLAFFYHNSSRSCFLLKNKLGSFVSTTETGDSNGEFGFLKVLQATRLSPPSSGESSSPNIIPILLPSIAFFVLLVLLFAGAQWRRRCRRGTTTKLFPMKHRAYPDGDSVSDEISIPGLPNRYTYAELAAATDNFTTKIGSGGFGEVFKGVLPDNSAVAVKRIVTGAGSVREKKEFCTEIAVISNIHHVNLVRLRGFCTEGRSRRLLVYEYMNRGSLDRSLFVSGNPVIEWPERIEIAVGAARGLAYLHSGCNQKIVHCDVKPENILLDNRGGVKISDFGLAKLITPEQSGLFTTMRGTRGYLAPEWLTNSAISDKTDVYSYGMVLLEIIRGRKNRSTGPSAGSEEPSGGEEMGYFPAAALEMHEKGSYLELADPRLEGRVTGREVERAVKVALCCLHEEPALRPAMASVAAMLEGIIEVAEPRPEALGFLRLYGRGDTHNGRGLTGDIVNGAAAAAAAAAAANAAGGSSSSKISYSYFTSQDISGPR